MSGVIEVFDNEVDAIQAVTAAAERVVIDARSHATYDAARLMDRLERMKRRERIKYLQVMSRSNVSDCEFLRYFPNLEGLTLSGQKLTSVLGVSFGARLQNLIVNAGKKNKVDLAHLPRSTARRLRLEGPRREDIQHVCACHAIDDLDLLGGEFEGLGDLRSMRLQRLTLISSRIAQIKDASGLSTLRRIWFSGCRELQGFTEEVRQLEVATVEACNKFNVSSLVLAPHLKVVRLMNCKNPFQLSELQDLGEVDDVTITNSALSKEPEELTGFRRLQKLWISPASDGFIQRISEQRPTVRVCNGKTLFIGGVKQSNMQDFDAGERDQRRN